MARSRRDVQKAAAFVERFASAMVDSGMPRMAARVFAVLLSEEDGQATAADLAEKLQASPAAVSGAVRYLVQVRLASRDRAPGERFDTYRLYSEVWYEAIYNREHELTRWSELSREGMKAVGPTSAAGRRLEDTAGFFEFLQDEMAGLLERWRARRP
jgi:DNA-binding transcriptional regulator GbsR (MarR family)